MPATVLVVDDSTSMRKLAAAVVRELGHQTVEAASGEEALELFDIHDVDLAVLDVQMPGIDGFELCRRLRKRAPRGWFPVIYLSASHGDEYIVEGLDAGGDAYVAKPLNPRVLEAIIGAMGRIADMKKALDDANATLRKQASLDGLTGLLNRRAFDEGMQRLLRFAKREKAELALMMIDVDHFKQFNDTYGHLAGDDCLREVAGGLKAGALRPLDTVARYGGEEFAIVLPRTPLTGAQTAAERVVAAVRKLGIAHAASSAADHVTVSIGLAMYREGDDAAALIARADAALYTAKSEGRDRYVTG